MTSVGVLSPLIERVSFRDAGVAMGVYHMHADAQTLDVFQANPVERLAVRVFQWNKPTVSYGYLLNVDDVRAWAQALDPAIDTVKRPTGGGAVRHLATDLSFSLTWRRDQKIFSDRPRDCYAEIHERLLVQLRKFSDVSMDLFAKETGCAANDSPSGLPVCFEEPVCNDVMQGDQKIIGGALRITKNAILYQGTIQLPAVALGDLKKAVREAFA